MLANDRPRSLSTFGYVIECHGVQIRAQLRSVATLVRVTGRIAPANSDLVLANLHRFALVESPLVLDLLDGHGFDGDWLQDVIDVIAGDSGSANTELTLVVDSPLRKTMASDDCVGVVGSVEQALESIAQRIRVRRAFLVDVMAGPPRLHSASGCR
jgi:hypothetical protein